MILYPGGAETRAFRPPGLWISYRFSRWVCAASRCRLREAKISLAGTLGLINTASAALSSSEVEVEEMRAARLKELEEMAAELLETARKLPSGQDRHSALQEIERFRARITALERVDLQSPQPYDLVTRPCTIHAGRFRWDIRQNGRPVQSSMESFASEQEAHMDGRLELEKLMRLNR
ncbi:MAG: hypothetical protein WCA28_22545 [Bradyrhizobium sp.]